VDAQDFDPSDPLVPATAARSMQAKMAPGDSVAVEGR
jgi:hypothetical protein